MDAPGKGKGSKEDHCLLPTYLPTYYTKHHVLCSTNNTLHTTSGGRGVRTGEEEREGGDLTPHLTSPHLLLSSMPVHSTNRGRSLGLLPCKWVACSVTVTVYIQCITKRHNTSVVLCSSSFVPAAVATNAQCRAAADRNQDQDQDQGQGPVTGTRDREKDKDRGLGAVPDGISRSLSFLFFFFLSFLLALSVPSSRSLPPVTCQPHPE